MCKAADTKVMKNASGFSLVEVLIAVGLLGLIATFTIPKVLQSTGESAGTARFKDSLVALQTAMEWGITTQELTLSNSYDFFVEHINGAKECDDAVADGCIGTVTPTCGALSKAIVLPTGAVLYDFDGGYTNGGGYAETVCIDLNGSEGPNTEGDDVLQVRLYYGTEAYDAFGEPGEIIGWGATSQARFKEIMTN